jgi:hypothetical protein
VYPVMSRKRLVDPQDPLLGVGDEHAFLCLEGDRGDPQLGFDLGAPVMSCVMPRSISACPRLSRITSPNGVHPTHVWPSQWRMMRCSMS